MEVLAPHFENIPEELRKVPNWVVWKAVPKKNKDGTTKLDKVPFDPKVTLKNAKTNDPKTWGTYEQAVETYKDHPKIYAGIGFVFSKEASFVGIDLDKCRDPETGIIEEGAADIIKKFSTYTEVSPSGTGVKMFLRGKLPSGSGNKNGNFEAYGEGRFFTVTGCRVGTIDAVNLPMEPQERDTELEWFTRKFIGRSHEQRALSSVSGVGDVCLAEAAEPPAEKFMLLAELDPDFMAVWSKQRNDLSSASEYDLSLARRAARCGWTDQEIANLVIAFRRKHGHDLGKVVDRKDYMRGTIAVAREDNLQEAAEKQIEEREIAAPAPPGAPPTEGGRHLEFLKNSLGIVVNKLVKFVQTPPHFKIYTELGAVDLGTATSLIDQGRFRERILADTRHLVPRLKSKQWDMVVRAFSQIWEEVDISDDMTDTGMVKAAMFEFLSNCSPHATVNSVFVSKASFALIYEGVWCVRLPLFIDSLQTEDKQFNRKLVTRLLKELGCELKVIGYTKKDGTKTTGKVWKVPFVKVPTP